MQNLWRDTLNKLENDLPHQIFNIWIKPIRCISINEEQITIGVPNKFFGEWIRDHYFSTLQQVLSKIGGKNFKIKIELHEGSKNKESEIKVLPLEEKKHQSEDNKNKNPVKASNLSQLYTFDKFVSGTSNQFAFAACQAVANEPAKSYNPLFIYGGVGLGKTHLINAIGLEIIKTKPKMNVIYYTAEKFINELINSIRYQKMEEFRKKFRSADVLLIDDVQFIAGKERTQEEFFHTFNALYEENKQIVVTSDKFPREIPGLEERIRSRFEWGLIADIQAPDNETKIAILRMKAEQNGLSIPEDVAYYLANSVSSNIRELEGYLVRIVAYANLMSVPVTEATAREVLKHILVEKSRDISVEEIQKTVATYFNIKVSELRSAKRVKNLVLPRQIAMYLSRQLTAYSFPDIGDRFGGKDHSTIIYAIKKMEKQMEEDVQLKTSIESIRAMLIR